MYIYVYMYVYVYVYVYICVYICLWNLMILKYKCIVLGYWHKCNSGMVIEGIVFIKVWHFCP